MKIPIWSSSKNRLRPLAALNLEGKIINIEVRFRKKTDEIFIGLFIVAQFLIGDKQHTILVKNALKFTHEGSIEFGCNLKGLC